ncbi:hypothetical protein ADU37_CDS16620 [Thermococcus sp. 2319x1]|nr:hypothetical protein ADU37_CDS16620 [Thermococcus sp. 2319x1]
MPVADDGFLNHVKTFKGKLYKFGWEKFKTASLDLEVESRLPEG